MSTALASLRDRHIAVSNHLEQARERIAQIIPLSTGLTPSRCIAVVLDALSRDPSLLECEPRSIVRTTIQAAEIGLELGSPLGEAYLVPFNNFRKNRKDASLIVGYKGFIKLAHGAFDPPRIVREGDTFSYRYGTSPEIIHTPGAGDVHNRGKITHAYAIAHVGDRVVFDVMDLAELERIRDAAKATKPSAPWNAHREEMYKKCPVRRLAKSLDLNPLTKRSIEVDDTEALRRGEYARDGFDAGRAEEFKALLRARNTEVKTIDAEFEEVPNGNG